MSGDQDTTRPAGAETASADNVDQARILAAAAIDAKASTAANPAGPAPAAAPGAAPGTAIAAPIDWSAESTQFVEFVCAGLVPLWPTLERVYTPEKQARIAAALAPVLRKYNLSLEVLFMKWAPEIGFAMVAVPLIVPTVEAVKIDRAARKAAAGKGAAAAPPASTAGASAAASSGGLPPDDTKLAERA